MQAFTRHTGRAVAIHRPNIDTDQIIPKQFLKRIERSGYGEFLFYDWRFGADGAPIPDFPLNDPKYSGASILIAGSNFGCGSSREHAPWSMLDYGFRVVIASSFADIFYNNSLKNGLLPVVLEDEKLEQLAGLSASDPSAAVTVDLEEMLVSGSFGVFSFAIDPFRRYCLLNGFDDIELTLQNEGAIANFEKTSAYFPVRTS